MDCLDTHRTGRYAVQCEERTWHVGVTGRILARLRIRGWCDLQVMNRRLRSKLNQEHYIIHASTVNQLSKV